MKRILVFITTILLCAMVFPAVAAADADPVMDLVAFPNTTNDTYGTVNADDPIDVAFDAETGEFLTLVYIPGVHPLGPGHGKDGQTVYLGGLVTGEWSPNGGVGPIGKMIAPGVYQFRHKANGKKRHNLPIDLPDGKRAWGWIMPTPCTQGGPDNGYCVSYDAKAGTASLAKPQQTTKG